MIHSINGKRVIVGGLAAGAVNFVLTGILNGALLSQEFGAWASGMGNLIHPPGQPVQMGLWTAMAFIGGILGIWLYAGIRAQYGAGAKTALRAGLLLWAVGKLVPSLDFLALGVLPVPLIIGQMIGSFIATMLGILLGAWLYREQKRSAP